MKPNKTLLADDDPPPHRGSKIAVKLGVTLQRAIVANFEILQPPAGLASALGAIAVYKYNHAKIQEGTDLIN